MKRLVVFCLITVLMWVSLAFADDIPLKFTWHAPTTSQGGGALTDLRGFDIFRTDGTRTKINVSEIPLSACTPAANGGACQYLWTLTVPINSAGSATFVLQSVDNNSNHAADSNLATYSWNVDTIPPAIIGDFGVVKQ